MKMIEIIASDLKETLLKDVALKYYEYLNKKINPNKYSNVQYKKD